MKTSVEQELILSNTSRYDKLLTDVNTDEMYTIIMNVCLEISKTHVLPKPSTRKHQILTDRRGNDEKRSQLQQIIQKATNHKTKENVLNQIEEIQNNLKISINAERNLKETRAIVDTSTNL